MATLAGHFGARLGYRQIGTVSWDYSPKLRGAEGNGGVRAACTG